MSLQSYLEKHYGDGDPDSSSKATKTKKKKSKKQHTKESSKKHSIAIVDNDADLIEIPDIKEGKPKSKDKSKDLKPKWITLGDGRDQNADSPSNPENSLPQPPSPPKTKYGIQTAQELRKITDYEELKRQALLKSLKPDDQDVYRDSKTGKIMRHSEMESQILAERERKKQEQEEYEAKRKEWNKGLVQRREIEERKRLEEEAKNTPFARYRRDDEDEIKSKIHWDDPMRNKLSLKSSTGSSSKSKKPKYPIYKGPPPPPNRFGILPGYRWDGVDRSNGFEKDLFLKQNERKARRDNEYAASYME
ncbi:Pre-mRNA-splicing factor cwc26 [Mycoemilia scoparia]|uniref:Pre-mRNA-splicing factor cwc26 n=1 Tax=Mycoemilia scoparia TaxID=417184 RepID=A0A9W7ZYE4_9FUNG|nr:Pre-mRNA-splicing factor cwc26 [Mycoemilia scoparia]